MLRKKKQNKQINSLEMSTVENLTQHLPCDHIIFVSNSVVNKKPGFH